MHNGAEVVVVSSGTTALYLSLAALGVRPRNKVIIPSYTCNSLYAAVGMSGATAVCADTATSSVNVDRNTVSPLISKSAAAVIVPHMFGFLADITPIRKLGIPVIEDCAQAAGVKHADGVAAGLKGDIGILSFFATKLIPAGEGGACITRNRRLADAIRNLRDCDKKPPAKLAFNFKITDICAALALSKLKQLRPDNSTRMKIAGRFDQAFGDLSFRSKSSVSQAVCFRYLISARSGVDAFIRSARQAGITCCRPVWRPLHLTIGGSCPMTEELDKRLVSVPIYPSLSEREIERICSVLPQLAS
jgi:perosamine synthetase